MNFTVPKWGYEQIFRWIPTKMDQHEFTKMHQQIYPNSRKFNNKFFCSKPLDWSIINWCDRIWFNTSSHCHKSVNLCVNAICFFFHYFWTISTYSGFSPSLDRYFFCSNHVKKHRILNGHLAYRLFLISLNKYCVHNRDTSASLFSCVLQWNAKQYGCTVVFRIMIRR